MSDLLLVVAMGAITYASRVVFLANPGAPPEGFVRRFLHRFPLALFVALAASILVIPDADVDSPLGWAAVAGALLGGWVTGRALYGVVGVGFAGYWLGRWLMG